MINELYELSKAMEKAEINAQKWHREYMPIPNINKEAPCLRIEILEGKVKKVSMVDAKIGAELRKFGGRETYPIMNLAPLYKITSQDIIKNLKRIRPEDLGAEKISEIKSWCKNNNWTEKFKKKYKNSMINTAERLLSIVPQYEPLKILIKETNYFLNPDNLHQELERVAFEMLDKREDVLLALIILFNTKEDDYSLSVAFDTTRLRNGEESISALSRKFVFELNDALLQADNTDVPGIKETEIDAFGAPFEPIEKPMPKVKLAGGFNVSLRTMFKGQKCQTRYGRIANATYPISPEFRMKLKTALEWVSSTEREEVTWIKIDKYEILFAYPLQLPNPEVSFVKAFKQTATNVLFLEQVKSFIKELVQTKEIGTDSYATQIQIFILRKIDDGRSKIVYTRLTDTHELEVCSENWTKGCINLPRILFCKSYIPYPLDVPGILNRFWKQNGELVTDKFNPVPQYHGLELLLEPDLAVDSDLHFLSEKVMKIGAFLGSKMATFELDKELQKRREYEKNKDDEENFSIEKIKEGVIKETKESKKIKDMLKMLPLLGLVLYRRGIRKDMYMEQLPYLYGQLLKVSDELHVMYCNVVRDGNLPAQLIGSSVYQAAAEAPIRTLALLGERMTPYITWGKIYCTKEHSENGKESWKVRWLLSLYEKTATKLQSVWEEKRQFNDAEKAQFFIGYLAAFSQKDANETRN